MRSISNNFLAFLYITLIITSSIGVIIIFTGFERSVITGEVQAQVGVCVVIMPTMEDIGNLTANVGQEFTYYVIAHDDNGVIFSDNTTLFNITYDGNGSSGEFLGLIQFTPTGFDIGKHNIRIYVNDSICTDAMVYDDFLLTINASAPVLDYIPDLSATEDLEFTYQLSATDPNNANITYNSNESWFLINATTGIINFIPINSEVGDHSINITVNNSYNIMDYQIVNFTVINTNDAPVLDFIPNQYINEDEYFEYDVDASDPDLNIPNSPEVLEFGDDTGLFNINEVNGVIAFTPDYDKVGDNQSVLIWVSDGEAIDFQYVNFTIIAVNDAPILTFDTAQTIYVIDGFYEYDIEATDEEDGDESTGNLTFWDNTTLFNISKKTGVFNITPTVAMIGTYNINISVNDSNGAITSAILSLTITNENRPPIITSYSPTNLAPTIEETESLSFSITASDPDGTTPSVSWFLDNVNTNVTSNNYIYTTGYEDAGSHNVTVIVSDGLAIDSVEWDVSVTDKAVPVGVGVAGGGGGGGVTCISVWVCTDWSPCTIDDIQIRECHDIKGCNLNRPDEVRSCIFVPIPTCNDGVKNFHDGKWEILVDCGGPCPMCPTCDDGIQNQGEKGIDCGGPCPLCPEIEVPLIIPPEKRINWWLFLILVLMLLVVINILKNKIKKIIEKKKTAKERDALNKIKNLIKIGKKAIKNNDMDASKQVYNKLEYWYGKLSDDNKKRIYDKIYKFYKKMKEI